MDKEEIKSSLFTRRRTDPPHNPCSLPGVWTKTTLTPPCLLYKCRTSRWDLDNKNYSSGDDAFSSKVSFNIPSKLDSVTLTITFFRRWFNARWLLLRLQYGLWSHNVHVSPYVYFLSRLLRKSSLTTWSPCFFYAGRSARAWPWRRRCSPLSTSLLSSLVPDNRVTAPWQHNHYPWQYRRCLWK